MQTEENIPNDTIEKLKFLIGNFNTLSSNIDIYTLCIQKRLKEKLQT